MGSMGNYLYPTTEWHPATLALDVFSPVREEFMY